MSEKLKGQRSARAGNYSVSKKGRDKRGAETWIITQRPSRASREVSTSASSAHALNRITKTHSKALKRLADK